MKSVLLGENGLVIAVLDYSMAVKVASFMSHTVCNMPWNPKFQTPEVGTIYRP